MSCTVPQRGAKLLAGLLVVAVALAGSATAAGPAETEAARVARERAAIVAERDRLEAQFAAELAACSSRFAVTACQDDARERRRVALEGPRARALALDDAERRSRAEARREAIGQKQRSAAERPPAAVAAAPASRERRPSPASAPAEASAAQPPAPSAAASAAAEAEAAQRAAAARQRQAAIKAEQARIEARQAERAQRGKSAPPLPVPDQPSRARSPGAPASAPS